MLCLQVAGVSYHLDLLTAPGTLTPLKEGRPAIPPGENDTARVMVQCAAVQYHGVCTIQYSSVQCYAVHCSSVQYHAVQYQQYHTVWRCTIIP